MLITIIGRGHSGTGPARLKEFLGIEPARISVVRGAVGRWKQEKGVNHFDFFAPAMAEYRCPAPKPARQRGTVR